MIMLPIRVSRVEIANDVEEERRGIGEAVEPVEDAAMAGKHAAAVLDARLASTRCGGVDSVALIARWITRILKLSGRVVVEVRARQRLNDALDFLANFQTRDLEVILALQVLPKLRSRPEIAGEP